MCGRYYVSDETAREIEKLVRQVNAKIIKERMEKGLSMEINQPMDVFPAAKAPVIISDRENEDDASLTMAEYTWGFPHFDKGKKVIFNARAESVLDKRMFRESTLKRRLIVPASGFYEWNSNKERFFFKSKDDKIMLFAGIYSGDRFVILTTDANDSVKDVHNRMPLILKPREIDDWIFDDKAVTDILRKTPQQLDKEMQEAAKRKDVPEGQMSFL